MSSGRAFNFMQGSWAYSGIALLWGGRGELLFWRFGGSFGSYWGLKN